jgi:hypothetical protein
MTDTYVLAFAAVLLIVGVVMVGVIWLARAGGRMATNPPSPGKRRLLAQSLIVFGSFALGFHVGAAVYGAEIKWLSVLVAIGLIVQGLFILRDLRKDRTSKTSP